MGQIEFYAYPTLATEVKGLELKLEMDAQNPLLPSPADQEQLERDWVERGYTRSSPVGTLTDVVFRAETGQATLRYQLTEYKVYSGLAYPALPDTGGKLSQVIKDAMRVSACGCVVETTDGKIITQRRKEGLIAGGMVDSGASGIMVYDPVLGKLDWRKNTFEKLSRELHLTAASQTPSIASQVRSLIATGVWSSRESIHIPAQKGYFAGDYSGTVGSRARVSLAYDEIVQIADRKWVEEIIGIYAQDLPDFIVEQVGAGQRGLTGDGCAALLVSLPAHEFQQTVERINSRGKARIILGSLRGGTFSEATFTNVR